MLRGMVFSDQLNFDIAVQHYYKDIQEAPPRLDYDVLFKNISLQVKNVDFLKAFIFYPKPDKNLMEDAYELNKYNWISGMQNSSFLDIIESSYIARPKNDEIPIDINDKSTYYKVEKGTDINMSIHALTKAFYNSYDVGFFISADTDYIPIYQTLKNLGKLVVVVYIKDQQIHKIKPHVDKHVILDKDFFDKCLRHEKHKGKGLM